MNKVMVEVLCGQEFVRKSCLKFIIVHIVCDRSEWLICVFVGVDCALLSVALSLIKIFLILG